MSEWMGAEDHVNKALEHYERGRWADAEAELRKALASEPDRGEWQFNLGLTLEAAGRAGEAFDCYSRAIELMPEEADPLLAAGTIANRLGRHEEALGLLERAVRLRREDDTAHAVWIDSLVCLGRLDEAETVFHLARQSVDECPRSLAAVAEALIRRGQLARAEWCLREAMRLEPSLSRVRARLAAVVAEHGGVERAVQLYLRELRDDPGAIDTQLDFADLLLRLGRLPEASERYRRVLELEPANVDAHHGLGRVAIRTGRFDQAILELELVSKLDASTPQVRLDLAEALLGLAWGQGGGTPAGVLGAAVASQASPPDPALEFSQARAAEAAGKLVEELELLRAGECETDRARLGMLLLRAGRPVDAIPLLEEVAEAMANASRQWEASELEAGGADGDAPSSDVATGEETGLEPSGPRVHGPGNQPSDQRSGLKEGLERTPARTSDRMFLRGSGRAPGRSQPRGGDPPERGRGPANGPFDGRDGGLRDGMHSGVSGADSERGSVGRPGAGHSGDQRRQPADRPVTEHADGAAGRPARRGEPMLADILRQLALAKFMAGDVAGGVRTSRRILAMDPTCVRSLHNLALAMLRCGHPRRSAIYVAAGLRVDRHDDGLRRLRARVWAQQARHMVRSCLARWSSRLWRVRRLAGRPGTQ